MATLLDPDRSVTAPGRGLLTVLLIGQAMATTDGSILVILANSIRHDRAAAGRGGQLRRDRRAVPDGPARRRAGPGRFAPRRWRPA